MKNFGDLEEETHIDIFSRLPAKSVGLCRCVSKSWQTLLSRPKFIRAHLYRSRAIGQRLIFDSDDCFCITPLTSDTSKFSMSDEISLLPEKVSLPNGFRVIYAYCDGLVLAVGREAYFFVINPTTREIKEKPRSKFEEENFEIRTLYGLGYDPVRDDYKVVEISYYYDYDYNQTYSDRTELIVHLYSLKTDSWKRVDSCPYHHRGDSQVDLPRLVVFVSGHFHWLARREANKKSTIAAFDLGEETFGEVTPPDSIDIDGSSSALLELGGCLGIQINDDVWVMKEYGVHESWTKFTMNMPNAPSAWYKPWVLGLLGEGEFVIRSNKQFVVYDLKQRTYKVLKISGFEESSVDAMVMVESLVSP